MSPFSLVPRDNNFFREFTNLADGVKSGARELRQMIATDPPDMDKVEAIKEIEHTCDEVTRGIIDRLNRTFITPLDREDIHALAGSLDDVMDAIDAAAAVIRLYRITRVRIAAKVKQLEHEADRAHQDAIVELFDQERDPIAVIKWKEIFDFLEAATDRCEDVANLLEGVVVKHA